MYRTLAFALLYVVSAVSLAADNPEFSGPEHCRVASDVPGVVGMSVSWDGECRDGYAHGSGTLEWYKKRRLTSPFEGSIQANPRLVFAHYEGGLKAGRMHGDGYLQLSSGTQYEGRFADGRYNGKGALLHIMGRYDGEFVDGCPQGKGKMVFTTGGSYDGQWQCGQFHGTGTAVYPSGRRVTTEWVDGIRADLAALLKADPAYTLKSSMSSGDARFSWDCGATGDTLPIDKTYTEMSEAEKRSVCAGFPLLDDGDEPPYPLQGIKPIRAELSHALSTIKKDSEGTLRISVDINAEGAPTRVSVYASPNQDIANYTKAVFLQTKFKPATCGGKPCASSFPFCLKFAYEK